jgi:hypothetical protein
VWVPRFIYGGGAVGVSTKKCACPFSNYVLAPFSFIFFDEAIHVSVEMVHLDEMNCYLCTYLSISIRSHYFIIKTYF